MANRLFKYNAGCATEPCCEDGPPPVGDCPDLCVTVRDGSGAPRSGATVNAGTLGTQVTGPTGRVCFTGLSAGVRYVIRTTQSGFRDEAFAYTLPLHACDNPDPPPVEVESPPLIPTAPPNYCWDFLVMLCNCGYGGVSITFDIPGQGFTRTVTTNWYGKARMCFDMSNPADAAAATAIQGTPATLTFSGPDVITQTQVTGGGPFRISPAGATRATVFMTQIDDDIRWCFRNIPDGFSGIDCRDYYPNSLTATFAGLWPGGIAGQVVTLTRTGITWTSGCLQTPLNGTDGNPSAYVVSASTSHTGACGSAPAITVNVRYLFNGFPNCTTSASDQSYNGTSIAEPGGTGGCPVAFYTGFSRVDINAPHPYTTDRTATVVQ